MCAFCEDDATIHPVRSGTIPQRGNVEIHWIRSRCRTRLDDAAVQLGDTIIARGRTIFHAGSYEEGGDVIAWRLSRPEAGY